VDAGLEPDQTYTWRIRAHNPAGASAWSNEVTLTHPGETETVPPSIPLSALRLWLKADTLETGKTTLWRDQSGQGNHAAATSMTYAPQTVENPNSTKSVRLTATQNQQLGLPNFMSGVSEGEAFIVLKALSAMPSATRGLWRMGPSNYSYYPNTNGTLTDQFGTSTRAFSI
jgi:hypothetical protein